MVAKFKKNKNARFAGEARREFWQFVIFSIVLGNSIIVVIGFLVISNFKINQKRAELNSQIEYLKTEIRDLEEKRHQLQARISQSSEEEYLEKEARENFNLKKPGEEVVIILPPKEKPSEEKTEKEKRWWSW